MKQFIYLFSGLLLLFASTPRVVAQEIGDYSQLNDENYYKRKNGHFSASSV